MKHLKSRTLTKTLRKAVKTFPVAVVTGPRQSGKTTLLKKTFSSTHKYLNLENIDVRQRAIDDPVTFFRQYKPPLIIDEIQYVPQLLSYIKTLVDQDRRPGQWLLTGSQNFALMKDVNQSLAGRAAVLSLLPFSVSESFNHGNKVRTIDNLLKSLVKNKKTSKDNHNYNLFPTIFRGLYPEISSNKQVDRQIWCSSYIATFLERDIRNLEQIGDLNLYQRFLRACAIRTGQILNLSEIGKEIGVTFTTARRWLSLLETSYQVFLLYPYFQNVGKRLVKRPKIYFTDPGLASYLLGLNTKESLLNSPHFGNLFETLVVIDFWKRFLHFGELPAMYYLRTRDNLEVDLVIETNGKLSLFEIKSSATITSQHAASLKKAFHYLDKKAHRACLISNSAESFDLDGKISNYRWQDMLLT